MKLLKYFVLALIITSCNSTRAVYDYDEKVDFSKLNTYYIYPDLVTNLNQLDEQRIVSIINEKMAAKGFTSTAENPHIYINFYSTDYETPTRNSVGVGVGGTGRNMGVGISGGIPLGGPDSYRRITFEFIDARNDALIWQAIVEGKFDRDTSPKKREYRLREMVDKALEGYPPKK